MSGPAAEGFHGWQMRLLAGRGGKPDVLEGLRRLDQVAPISTNLILLYVAEPMLGLPRSFCSGSVR